MRFGPRSDPITSLDAFHEFVTFNCELFFDALLLLYLLCFSLLKCWIENNIAYINHVSILMVLRRLFFGAYC